MVPEEIQEFMVFLKESPTAWHAVRELQERLLKADFICLSQSERWDIQPGKRYFTIKNGSSLCAFVAPLNPPTLVRLAASHTDSPSLKLKPHSEFYRNSMVLFGVEVYGGPLLSSWLNRDLGIAGRVIVKDADGSIVEKLVRLEDYPVVIPQLAIHLDPQVNENGLVLNKQNHLSALAALELPLGAKGYLDWLLKHAIGEHLVLGADLFLFPLEGPSFIGYAKEMLAAYRIDSLASVHAIWGALEQTLEPENENLKMMVVWDNEEIGSATAQGAESPFLAHTLERIMIGYNQTREDYLRLLNNSMCISVDLAHAVHPNYLEKHDPLHQPVLGEGIVLKSNAKQRYASEAWTSALITHLCQKEKIPLQHFVSRGDMPCGSTIGPLHATSTGMPTVDIGCPQLSMHAARELMANIDYLHMRRLLEAFFKF
ncbi:M18 family aminopeptidase [Parachlamydia sp. AcF125]|uniref:M18 family aminopeptidase n=1 Tax=Parachlamydia sp. AcF125 TaxID=2795736 RepID=UPI001BC98F47|nr:M18 family aminopeptidase [Parachlamydia sp. AcF125]MBS4167400.1 putative M18 family aminopeptidase 2 [Parachlamydia sp. AcF125]